MCKESRCLFGVSNSRHTCYTVGWVSKASVLHKCVICYKKRRGITKTSVYYKSWRDSRRQHT